MVPPSIWIVHILVGLSSSADRGRSCATGRLGNAKENAADSIWTTSAGSATLTVGVAAGPVGTLPRAWTTYQPTLAGRRTGNDRGCERVGPIDGRGVRHCDRRGGRTVPDGIRKSRERRKR